MHQETIIMQSRNTSPDGGKRVEKKLQDSVIAKQEKAARQQELLEKKRQARAEYNVSGGHSTEAREKKHQEQILKKQQKQQIVQTKKQEKKKKKFADSFQKAVAFDDAEGVSVSEWFLSICWIKIPVIGFIYVLTLALSKKTHQAKRNFARGYLIYRCLVVILSVTVLYVLYQVGLSFVDQLLSFVK